MQRIVIDELSNVVSFETGLDMPIDDDECLISERKRVLLREGDADTLFIS